MVDDQAFLLLAEEGAGTPGSSLVAARPIKHRRGSFLFPANAAAPGYP